MKYNLVRATVAAALITLGVNVVSSAEEIPSASQTFDQRLAILERKYENDQDVATARAKEGTTASARKDGFIIKTNDGSFSLKVGGLIQSDYRDYLGDRGSTTQFADQFLLRRTQLSF